MPVVPIIRRLDIHVGACCGCHRRIQGRHPLQTSAALGAAAAQLGPHAIAPAVQLNKQFRLSFGNMAMPPAQPQVQPQIEGTPGWASTERFDIAAKMPDGAPPEQMPAMLRSLLEDRFALRTHLETREEAIDELVVAREDGRLGRQMTRTTVDCGPIRERRAAALKEATGCQSSARPRPERHRRSVAASPGSPAHPVWPAGPGSTTRRRSARP